MAELAKSGRPSLATLEPGYEHQHNNLVAGETLTAGDMVYVASGGKVMLANGVAANAASLHEGMVLQDAVINDGVTIEFGVTVHYGSGLTPGARYFLSAAVPGGLSTTATTGSPAGYPVAKAIDTSRIFILTPIR